MDAPNIKIVWERRGQGINNRYQSNLNCVGTSGCTIYIYIGCSNIANDAYVQFETNEFDRENEFLLDDK